MRYRSLLHSAAFAKVVVLLTLSGAISSVSAQEMDHSRPSVESTPLTVRALDGKSITFTPQEFAALPHKTVSVYNFHTKANETYSGVPLIDLLARLGAPHGEEVKGKVFTTAVIAKGTDMYSVLFALAEVDPSIHTGEVIVADSVGGQKLGKDGDFKMVSSEERRPARWVRNLTEVSLIEVKP